MSAYEPKHHSVAQQALESKYDHDPFLSWLSKEDCFFLQKCIYVLQNPCSARICHLKRDFLGKTLNLTRNMYQNVHFLTI